MTTPDAELTELFATVTYPDQYLDQLPVVDDPESDDDDEPTPAA